MTTGKTIVLINLTFVGKIMSVLVLLSRFMGFPDSSVGKESTCNAGDPSSNPGLGGSPGDELGYHFSILA